MAEKYNSDTDKTRIALEDCYKRLCVVSEKIDRANRSDDLDEFERFIVLREKLLERVDFLKARLRVEIDADAIRTAEAAGFNLKNHYQKYS